MTSSPTRRDLAGCLAVVTGATSGIGRAIATALAAERARLCLVGRREDALQELVVALEPTADAVVVQSADLSDEERVAELVDRIAALSPTVDVLVHAAAVISLGPVDRAPVEEFDRQYKTNVRAPYLLTQALLPGLRAARGQVVFVNSTSGRSAQAGAPQYAATKHALKALANSLRQEVNADGIRVLSVFPGRTATPMQEALHAEEGLAYRPDRLLQPDDVAATVISALTLPATAEVTDVFIRPMQKPL